MSEPDPRLETSGEALGVFFAAQNAIAAEDIIAK